MQSEYHCRLLPQQSLCDRGLIGGYRQIAHYSVHTCCYSFRIVSAVMAFSVRGPANGYRRPSSLRRSVRRGEPPENEEVAAAERASEGQKKPVESCLKGVPVAYASEID